MFETNTAKQTTTKAMRLHLATSLKMSCRKTTTWMSFASLPTITSSRWESKAIMTFRPIHSLANEIPRIPSCDLLSTTQLQDSSTKIPISHELRFSSVSDSFFIIYSCKVFRQKYKQSFWSNEAIGKWCSECSDGKKRLQDEISLWRRNEDPWNPFRISSMHPSLMPFLQKGAKSGQALQWDVVIMGIQESSDRQERAPDGTVRLACFVLHYAMIAWALTLWAIGLHLSIYQAVLRGNGQYTSPSAGAIDLNQELCDPMEKEFMLIGRPWLIPHSWGSRRQRKQASRNFATNSLSDWLEV